MANPLTAPLLGFLGKLSFPRLFMVTASLFLVDLAIPLDDVFPPFFLDELMLGLGTLLLGSWKKRRETPTPPSR